jgi:hypothetical protein
MKKVDKYYLTQILNYEWAYLTEENKLLTNHWLDIKYGFITGLKEDCKDSILSTFVSQIVSYLCYENYEAKKKPSVKDIEKVLNAIGVEVVDVTENEILDNLDRGDEK